MLYTREPTDECVAEWRERLRLIGARPAGICRGHDLVFEIGTSVRHGHSCCCGGDTMAELPYQSATRGELTTYAKVCAVCDAATQFPRIAE